MNVRLTLILLTWRIWWAPNNASKWQTGFNSAFKGLKWKATTPHYVFIHLYRDLQASIETNMAIKTFIKLITYKMFTECWKANVPSRDVTWRDVKWRPSTITARVTEAHDTYGCPVGRRHSRNVCGHYFIVTSLTLTTSVINSLPRTGRHDSNTKDLYL